MWVNYRCRVKPISVRNNCSAEILCPILEIQNKSLSKLFYLVTALKDIYNEQRQRKRRETKRMCLYRGS